MSQQYTVFDHDKWDSVGHFILDYDKKAEQTATKRIKPVAKNNCRMVAIIKPEGKAEIPTKLDLDLSNKSESLKTLDSEGKLLELED